jgi:hypothetical protein
VTPPAPTIPPVTKRSTGQHTPAPGKTRPVARAHWALRTALWGLLSIVLISGISASNVPVFSDPFAAEIASSPIPGGPVSTPSVSGPAPVGPVYVPNSQYADPRDQGSMYQPLVTANSGENGEEMNMVPAWRWRDDTGFHDSYDWKEIAESGVSAIAGVFFGIAGFIWLIILGTLRFGLDLNLLDRLGEAGSGLSDVFSRLSDTLVGSGLVLLVLVAAVISLVRASLRGNLVRGLSTFIAAVIPIAALLAFSAAASSDAARGDEGSAVVGSPVYLAQRGLNIADRMAGTVGTYVGDLAGFTSEQSAYAELSPSCVDYTEALRRGYRYSRSLADEPSTSTEAVLTVSSLWERGYLANWIIAQYNGSQPGWRIWCHHLEANANTPRSEQVLVGNLAGYPSINTEEGKNPFVIQLNQGKGQRASMWIWAACVHNGSAWQAQAAWNLTGEITGADCANWWAGESADKNLAPWSASLNKKLLQWDAKPSQDNSGLSPLGSEGVLAYQSGLHDDTDDIRAVIDGTVGDNAATRLMAGLITLVTAIVFLYALGAISIGTVVAKIGFVVMLVLLPGTLFLLALPTGGRGRHPAGVKMLKMTGSYLAANFVLTGVLILLLAVINVLTTLVVSSVPLGGTSGLLTMVVPLASLFVLRKALKSVGMGDITSAKGALGLATSAGIAGAEGRNAMRSAKNRQDRLNDPNRKNNLMNRMGKKLDRFDRAAKAPKNWARDRAKFRAGAAGRNLADKSTALANRASNALTGHTVSDWASRLSDGSGSLGAKLTTAAGLGKILGSASHKVGLHGIGDFVERAGEKITSFNPTVMDDLRQKQLQDEHRRELWEVTRDVGPDPQARHAAIHQYLNDKSAQLAGAQQHITLAAGATLPDGTAIMAFTGQDAEGKRFILTPEAAGYNAATGTVSAGVEIHTDPVTGFITPELKDLQSLAARQYGVESSNIGIGKNGTGPVFLPSANAKTPPVGLSFEHAMVAANAGTFFVPEDVRARVRHLDATSQADFYQSYAIAAGVLDPATGATGALARLGFDPSSRSTELMVEAWSRGEDTALSTATIDIPSAMVNSLVAAATTDSQNRKLRDSGFEASAELRKVIDRKALSVPNNTRFLKTAADDLDKVVVIAAEREEIVALTRPALETTYSTAETQLHDIEHRLSTALASVPTGTPPESVPAVKLVLDERAAQLAVVQDAQNQLDALANRVTQIDATIDQTMTRFSHPKMMEQIITAHADVAMIPELVNLDKELRAGRMYEGIKQIEVAAQAASELPPIKDLLESVAGATPAERAAEMARIIREQALADAEAKVSTSHMVYARETRNRFTSKAYVSGMMP